MRTPARKRPSSNINFSVFFIGHPVPSLMAGLFGLGALGRASSASRSSPTKRLPLGRFGPALCAWRTFGFHSHVVSLVVGLVNRFGVSWFGLVNPVWCELVWFG